MPDETMFITHQAETRNSNSFIEESYDSIAELEKANHSIGLLNVKQLYVFKCIRRKLHPNELE